MEGREKERQGQLEDLEKEINMKEDQQKTIEEKLTLLTEEHKDEQKRRQGISAVIFGEIICQKLEEPIE